MKQVQHPYSAVYVLLLSWKHDDLGVETDIQKLNVVFGEAYGFLVQRFLIPNEDPDEALAEVLKGFVQRYQSPQSLLIVYYGGHGSLNDARLALWFCTSRRESPHLKWYSHQRVLEDSTSHVLLLLDCCQPLGGGGSVRADTSKEVLAACGFGSEAPGVGENSFSRALIEELIKSVPNPFTTSQLHYRIVNRLRTLVPGPRGEVRETPILGILGEGGLPNPSIQLVSYSTYPVNLIAVMGLTGSGKSSLINRICGREVAKVSQSQESTTKEVTHYITIVNGEATTLIDTPGFDDTNLTDRIVLERISTYLFKHYQGGRKLSGLLYLRDINTDKMTGSAVKNLDMFQRLCGEESLGNVMLLTTKWDKPADLGQSHEDHEEELIKKFWAGMIKLGCSHPKRLGAAVDPSPGIVNPVSDIIAPMLRFEPVWLKIQRELSEGTSLMDTLAGQYVDQKLSVVIAEHMKSAESALVAAQESRGTQWKAALVEQAEAHQSDLKEAKDDKDALREDFEKVMDLEAERRSKLFGFNLLDRLDDYLTELDIEDKKFRLYTIGIASAGLFRACKYIWKKQGESQDLIESTENAMVTIG